MGRTVKYAVVAAAVGGAVVVVRSFRSAEPSEELARKAATAAGAGAVAGGVAGLVLDRRGRRRRARKLLTRGTSLTLGLGEAAKVVAELTGGSANELYGAS